jgi:hypothetical protein
MSRSAYSSLYNGELPWRRKRLTAQSYEPPLDPPEIPPRELKVGMSVSYYDRWMSIHEIEGDFFLIMDKDLKDEYWVKRDEMELLEPLE